ncbi:PREDICTED: 60S ribosomal protein L23-like [Populus euphratica]|uniref:60S ribosomal protein L23-like n=1 Tax=Populus euphratica TaxID=75702 RepID=A0AAJ6V3U9_POPEU|nr:PREDICTED: 60S ribosomal protein L23-like [Populus euphratica]
MARVNTRTDEYRKLTEEYRKLRWAVAQGIKGRLNRLLSAYVGDLVMAIVKKEKLDLRKKVMSAVIVRQRKSWRQMDGVFIFFEDNVGVIVNLKEEMKGSVITGLIGEEYADLWSRIASAANSKNFNLFVSFLWESYCC